MKDFTQQQAEQWVLDEVSKVTTKEKAVERIASIKRSADGFWKTPAGIEAGRKLPNARAAQLKLVDALTWIYFTTNE